MIVKRRVSFHSWEGYPLINGNPEVAYFTTNFSERDAFAHGYTWLAVMVKDGFQFIHGRGTPLLTGTLNLHILALTFLKAKLFPVQYLASRHR